ncbi:M56 family metallopeptidase [Flavobacterium sp. N2270]|uniref:M56 family metallopeptidase n=1 Tax=Flavobacterium sp. N2270 TaxID=2986831 RepID=UPI0022253F61|nr:M56 family metallopeptidase [Flavobacterium sp. N2270]
MEAIFTYFLKVNGLLITFFLAYYFLLRKETFFNKNRWFLLLGLFASVILPLITFTKIVWVEPSPVIYETVSTDFVPYIIENKVIEEPIDWNSILFYVYLGISVVFMVKILIEILSFFRIIKFGKRTKTKEAILIDNESNENPFSFFNHIVFNRRMFTEEELQHIISHEKIHVKEKHSIDVLISKIFCALFWVNPIMWFYQKEILQNLEYIADAKASVITQDKINYQKTLLKVVTNQHQLSITNQFYQSLIKKRIVMLNTNQSNQRKSWKYALILPVLSAFMLLLQVETVAQVKENPINSEKKVTEAVAIAVGFVTDKNASDAEMKLDTEELKKQGIDYKFSKIKRNKKGEIIAIKIEFNDNKGNKGVKEIKGNEPIEPIYFSTESNSIGFTEAPDLSDYIVDEKLSKQFGTEVKVKMATVNEAKKNKKNELNQLYIINGKEYLQSEVPKGTTVSVDGSITVLSKEEGIKKYGQKAKDGVLIFNGKSFFVNEEENQVLKNIKLTFQKGKEYIIGGKKYTYNDLKDKNWFLYTGTPNKIEEKNNIVTITGDVVVDAENSNTQEVIYVIEPEKIENKKFVLENGNWLVIFENEMIKIPKYPTYSLKNIKIEIDGTEVSNTYESFKKYDSNSFKEIKVIEDQLSTDENLIIQKIIIKTK